ncbi:hypothetical protein [Streptomyces anulatus]|uniref:hypothetical protein n=1 Tax=Streptomyces anulatus TaxID=1892 RepID=UPI00342F60A7
MTAAEPCLSPTGLALLPLVYAAKGLCLLRDRRTAACPPGTVAVHAACAHSTPSAASR